MRIDSSGNVGIGVTSMTNKLVLPNSAYFAMQDTGGAESLAIRATTANAMEFVTGGGAKMYILSTGDVAFGNSVANTASGYSNQPGGGYVASDAHFEFATSSNRAAVEIGKNNANDGQLIAFRKQSTPVGSIGVSGGNNLYISGEAALHSGLTFATNEILPTAQGSITDGAESLGSSSNRFKDLYLSDGVYLGGTAAANYLDDYEEGTWTPLYKAGTSGTPTTTSSSGHYRKVGSLVTVSLIISGAPNGASGALYISGLPFTSIVSGGYGTGHAAIYGQTWSWAAQPASSYVGDNTSNIYLWDVATGNQLVSDMSAGGNNLETSFTYITNS
jgi:hypothetical protein